MDLFDLVLDAAEVPVAKQHRPVAENLAQFYRRIAHNRLDERASALHHIERLVGGLGDFLNRFRLFICDHVRSLGRSPHSRKPG
jgi:hypothetical protein